MTLRGEVNSIAHRSLQDVQRLHELRTISDNAWQAYCFIWRNSAFRFSGVAQTYDFGIPNLYQRLTPEELTTIVCKILAVNDYRPAEYPRPENYEKYEDYWVALEEYRRLYNVR